MAAGNILIVLGVGILAKTNIIDLLRPRNLNATIIFLFGIIIMFYKFILLGFIIEIIGIYLLFCDKIPTMRDIGKKLLFKIIRVIK